MPLRTLILAASAVGLMLALVLLLVQVNQTPRPDIPDSALEAARQRYQRANRSRPAPSAPVSGHTTKSRTSASRPRPAKPESSTAPSRVPTVGTARKSADAPRPEVTANDQEMTMDDINRLYDRRDFESALAAAKQYLDKEPGVVRMLRVVVASACIMGDAGEARSHYKQLPARDQADMRRRCTRYGMELDQED